MENESRLLAQFSIEAQDKLKARKEEYKKGPRHEIEKLQGEKKRNEKDIFIAQEKTPKPPRQKGPEEIDPDLRYPDLPTF